MDSRKIVLLVGALLIAGITAFFARSLIAGSAAPQAAAMQPAAAPVVTSPRARPTTARVVPSTPLAILRLLLQPRIERE